MKTQYNEERVMNNIFHILNESAYSKRTFINFVNFKKYDPRKNPMLRLAIDRNFVSAISAEGVQYLHEPNIHNIKYVINNFMVHPHVDILHISHGYNDFWYLKTFFENSSIKPNIIAIRYNRVVPNDKSITVPFSKRADNGPHNTFGHYNTCSIVALSKILTEYKYIGDSCSILSYWVRSDLPNSNIFINPNIHCRNEFEMRRNLKDWNKIKGLLWVNVK